MPNNLTKAHEGNEEVVTPVLHDKIIELPPWVDERFVSDPLDEPFLPGKHASLASPLYFRSKSERSNTGTIPLVPTTNMPCISGIPGLVILLPTGV